MPEYRRFIAYFYEYIDGRKQRSAGFAKVELRGGIWRILFRLTAENDLELPVKIYGFVRQDGYLLGLPMGAMRTGQEAAQEWAYRADVPIKEKYLVEDLAGIWVQSSDGRSFLTVWDEDEIDPEKFVLELPEKARPENEREMEQNAREMEESFREEERETQTLVQEASGDETSATGASGSEAVREKRLEAGAAEKGTEGHEAALSEMPETEAIRSGTQDFEVRKENMPETEADGQASEIGMMEMKESITGAADVEEPEVEAAEGKLQEMEKGPAKGKMPEIETGPENLQGSRFEAATVEKDIAQERAVETGYEKSGDIQELFRTRPRCQPFQDGEFTACVMLRPCDIVWLQQKGWQVGRSSFLQHGFYQYRHLLLGITGDDSYIIGVPGIYNPQEKYMAGMFGFEAFKESGPRRNNAEFGYWYRKLERRM